jgi:Zn-dependent alcohol dehydrogenase
VLSDIRPSVGLMGVAGAALRGAGRIVAVGSRPDTLTLARQYGATNIVDCKKGSIIDQVLTPRAATRVANASSFIVTSRSLAPQ